METKTIQNVIAKLNADILDYITNDIQQTCRRLGVNAEFFTKNEKDYRGDEYSIVKSAYFQMMPMIFKDIHVEGELYMRDMPNNDEYYEVWARLDYKYTHFNGGTNGCELGTVVYRVRKDYDGKDKIFGIETYVEKVRSIEI